MCTYNGCPFLVEQLASIADQTRQCHEVVVCDDGSSDGTVAEVRRFAASAPFAMQIVENPENLGTTRNFEKAISLCDGDVIVLSDQDDIWMPAKAERMIAQFEQRPDLGFVFTDAEAVDERGRPMGYCLWEAVPFSRRQRASVNNGCALSVLLRRNVVTGATLAFRAKFRSLLLPIPRYCQHDEWIALLLSAIGPCVALDERLIKYRQHPRQQLGERPRSLRQQYLVARRDTRASFELVAQRFAAARQRLAASDDPVALPGAIKALDGKIRHFTAKVGMRTPGCRRLPAIWREMVRGNYARYSLGWKSLAQDIFL